MASHWYQPKLSEDLHRDLESLLSLGVCRLAITDPRSGQFGLTTDSREVMAKQDWSGSWIFNGVSYRVRFQFRLRLLMPFSGLEYKILQDAICKNTISHLLQNYLG